MANIMYKYHEYLMYTCISSMINAKGVFLWPTFWDNIVHSYDHKYTKHVWMYTPFGGHVQWHFRILLSSYWNHWLHFQPNPDNVAPRLRVCSSQRRSMLKLKPACSCSASVQRTMFTTLVQCESIQHFVIGIKHKAQRRLSVKLLVLRISVKLVS